KDWAATSPAGAARRLTVRFWLRPAEILGAERVSGLTLERTRLDEQGRLVGTGELETLGVQLVLRSVGYQSVPLPGVPFDERSCTVPHSEGRVLGADGQPLPGGDVAGRRPCTGRRPAAQGRNAALSGARARCRGGSHQIPAGADAGGPRDPAGQLRRLAEDRDGRDGTRHRARSWRPGQTSQPRRDLPDLRPGTAPVLTVSPGLGHAGQPAGSADLAAKLTWARHDGARAKTTQRANGIPGISLTLLAVLAVLVAAQPAQAARGQRAVAAVRDVRQLITVTAASHATTYATLRAYRVSGSRRVLVFGPWQ